MDTQNYKRTIKGSVGAGVSAIVNGGGRTYYILEHKNDSQFHKAGDTQKIIVDQIELGRAASCQVRFDESFETVSRKHAAIIKEGDNWKLIHLSQSNPTLVNGHPITDSYYLQTGDEIQLSVNGPRLGFIVPQGRQALTSSIGMTERMNLFRQQALRPYKTALIIISIVFVLSIGGLIAAMLHQNKEFDQIIAETNSELVELNKSKNDLVAQNEKLKVDMEAAHGKNDDLTKRYEENLEKINALSNEIAAKDVEIKEIIRKQDEQKANTANDDTEMDFDDVAEPQITSVSEDSESVAVGHNDDLNVSGNLKDYYDYIYTIKIDRIEIEMNGKRIIPDIQLSDIICGTGFMLSNGTFVTDRQNVQPWVYSLNAEWKEPWRYLMAQYVACGGNVIIHYRAYSTLGTGKPISFVNTEFVTKNHGDAFVDIKIERDFRKQWKKDFEVEINKKTWVRRNYARVATISTTSRSFAYIRNKGEFGKGIPYDLDLATKTSGGTQIHMVGYAGATDPHNPVPAHFNDRTNVDDTLNETIVLQGQVDEAGYYGSPAFYFYEKEKCYKAIGLMVGSVYGRDRLVPINQVLNN